MMERGRGDDRVGLGRQLGLLELDAAVRGLVRRLRIDPERVVAA
jgi:hypothetical protein